ncbi:MAG TPA: type IV secretion system protein VirB10 [Steroidobacteraceae bacterium]|jgi:type IV secretion system protein VirB10
MSERGQAPDQVQGERGNSVTRVLSAQSRVSSVLAIGLMSILGLGSLTWYYANALMRQGRAKQTAQAASISRAQGDMPLPSLGRIEPPLMPPPSPIQDQLPPAVPTLTEIPLGPSSTSMANAVPPPKTPAELAVERQLSGAVFASHSAMPVPGPANTGDLAPAIGGAVTAAPLGGELSTLLHPSVTKAVRAQLLPAQRLLLPKGAFIDCTLETAIDSTLPGMTTCIMATDAFGVDGKVVLLERGTKLIGETRGQVAQGAARIFVLWTEARTPAGVVVPLDSPGADELGRSGLPGEVNRHFWERFGAAMLVSVIDGAVQTAAQSSHSGSGAIVINPSASQDVLTEILKNTINIPPTVVKQNGDRIQVLVARDLDFRSVYELRSASDR